MASSLARAFHDDPVMQFLFPDEKSRPRRLTTFFRTAMKSQHLPHGTCYTNEDRSAAALWDPPGHWRMTGRQALVSLPGMLASLRFRIPTALRCLPAMERPHPRDPHFYLAVLGTRPDRQGHGLGSALMEPVLSRCDAEGIGAYLESSKESNVPFYRRHGFEVVGDINLPGGPTIWPMWRDPRRPGSA
jgi:GNAT superfamily N-acetyltransferase